MKSEILKFSVITAISVSAALIFGISGCNADKTDKDVKTSGKLYAMGVKLSNSETLSEEDSEKNSELVFTGDNIDFFNVTTGEIAFVGLSAESLMRKFGLYSLINFYIDERLLFKTIVTIPISSIPTPVIISHYKLSGGIMEISFDNLIIDDKVKAFLRFLNAESWGSGEWNGNPFSELDFEKWKSEQEEWKNNSEDWKAFIKYLRENKKIKE